MTIKICFTNCDEKNNGFRYILKLKIVINMKIVMTKNCTYIINLI